MSNEKPVRITVGDVKEVTEATTVQSEVAKEAVSYSPTPSVSSDTSSSPMVILGGVIGFILLVIAGYIALGSGAPTTNATNAPALSSSANNAPAANTPAENTPAANVPASNNPPTEANNAPVANNAPADANNTAPASNNAPAANTP